MILLFKNLIYHKNKFNKKNRLMMKNLIKAHKITIIINLK